MHFNERFLASHKRLAHRRKSATTEKEILDQIQSLFKRLTRDAKQTLLHQLSATTEAEE